MALAEESGADAIDARVVKALGHPTRVRILDLLRERELVSPVQLAEELGLALGTVGYHVRRLESLGFIELAKRTQRRGAVEHHYRACAQLDPPRAAPAPVVSVRGRRRAPSRASTVGAIVHEAQAAVARGGFDAVASRIDRRVALLDAPGRTRLGVAVDDLIAAIARIERDSARRLAAAGGQAHACTAVALAFAAGDELS